jgi:uncharacterized BrkB/YihY/UPF0761 family membrane protein
MYNVGLGVTTVGASSDPIGAGIIIIVIVLIIALILGFMVIYKGLKSKNIIFKVFSVGFLIQFLISLITLIIQLYLLRNRKTGFLDTVNKYYIYLWLSTIVILIILGLVQLYIFWSKDKEKKKKDEEERIRLTRR